jgi:PAB1-binding protein PBP1
MSLLAVISGISVGCSRGSVVTEDSLSSTELLIGSWTESVKVAGVNDSVWTAEVEISGSKSEVKEVMNVVGPPRMSGVDVSMLVRSSEAVAVDKLSISLVVMTLL